MPNERLVREQLIPRQRDEVFAFFANAGNLQQITPASVHFEIQTPTPIVMQVGTIIQYSLRIHGIPVHWTTAITRWQPPLEFADVQLSGPYRLWHHVHRFEEVDGQTRMVDEIDYRLPFGLFGRLAHRLFVRRDLITIFDYRRQEIERLFGPANHQAPSRPTERGGA